jgi:hypothetical protein
MCEYIVDRGMFLVPSIATQGTTFTVSNAALAIVDEVNFLLDQHARDASGITSLIQLAINCLVVILFCMQ